MKAKKKPSRAVMYLQRMRADGFVYVSRLVHKDDLADVEAIIHPRLAQAAADRRLKRGNA